MTDAGVEYNGVVLALIVLAVCAPIAGIVRQARGGGFMFGFFLGVLLGPFGILVAALMGVDPATRKTAPSQRDPSRMRRECPHCQEPMRRDAFVCPHCQRDSEPWTFRDGRWWTRSGDDEVWLDEKRGTWVRNTSPEGGAGS
jgi:hypothetical protein